MEWCTAEASLEVDDYTPNLLISCDLEAEHPASSYPKYLHWDKRQNLLWCHN
jgi:hypothetical protein